MPRTIKGDTALEYLERFPDTPGTSLAKKMYNENKEVFKNVDDAHQKIRYYRGQLGNHNRKTMGESKFISKPSEFYNPYKLPESDAEETPPYILPKNRNNILLLSDIHIPYHDIDAVTAALDYGKEHDINTIYLNGDTFDFYGISRWEKDPRKRSFKDEIEACKEFLAALREHFPGVGIYFKMGNHEVRWEAFLKNKAPELLDMSEFKLSTIFRFGENFIEEIEDKRMTKAGKLNILHGHEFGRSVFSPVNPARGYYNRGKTTMIAGHNHQTSEHSEKNLDGEVVTVWSTGCLCELKPDYMPFNKWNHGFAHIKVKPSGHFNVNNMRIINGKIV